jgi:hypothetical protein
VSPQAAMSNRRFLLCCVWVIVAGSLLGNGATYHVLWAFVTGMVMSVVCPLGWVIQKAIRK